MNSNKIVVILSLLISVVTLNATLGQESGGLQVYGGYVVPVSDDLSDYTVDGVRGGFVIGADTRLLGQGLNILIGGRYAFMNAGSDDEFSMTTGRIGLGFTLLEVSRRIRIRSKLAAAVHFVTDFPTGLRPDGSGSYLVNDSFAGAVTGLGIDIGVFTIDLEYEYGLINAINKESDTTLDWVALTAGVHF